MGQGLPGEKEGRLAEATDAEVDVDVDPDIV